jgi:uncharacterized protein YodC (DUF2158 family)
MRLSRLVLILLILAVGYWLLTKAGIFRSASGPEPSTAPVDRARTAAAASSGRAGETDTAQREADAASPSGAITENMTPDQVRALLGAPEETVTETSETGASRERWIYRRVGKSVVFENGVVVRVE